MTAYFTELTNKDARAQLSHPNLWSYILRDPTGVIYSHGRLSTRKECERTGIGHAEEFDGNSWPLDGWRLLVWPPNAKSVGPLPLSQSQIDLLRLGVDHKLTSSSMGWSYDEPGKRIRAPRIYSNLTTEMLYEQGFLNANFSDSRVVYGGCEIIKLQNLDGARHEHSPEIPKFQVWTSVLGKQLLKDKGLLLDDTEKLRYH